MGQSSTRPTSPPTCESESVLGSEQSLRGTLPEREEPFSPTSSARLRVAPGASTLGGHPLSDEAWAASMCGAPRVIVDPSALRLLDLNHRAGFVLSLMDAMLDLDTVLDLCGMERLEALQLIRAWHEAGVVEFR